MRERWGNVIALEERPTEGPAEVPHRDEGVVISRGTRVYLRTFARRDLTWLTEWVEDPYLDRMVGSEFLHSFKHDWDKAPGFHEAVMNDPTQVVLMVEAYRAGRSRSASCGCSTSTCSRDMHSGNDHCRPPCDPARLWRRGRKADLVLWVDVLGIRRIEAKVYAYNVLSMNSLRRNGFHQEGVLRQAGFDGTRYWDVVVFGILKDEIEAVRKRDKVYLPLDEPEGNVIEPT
jgi:hypothetical protein